MWLSLNLEHLSLACSYYPNFLPVAIQNFVYKWLGCEPHSKERSIPTLRTTVTFSEWNPGMVPTEHKNSTENNLYVFINVLGMTYKRGEPTYFSSLLQHLYQRDWFGEASLSGKKHDRKCKITHFPSSHKRSEILALHHMHKNAFPISCQEAGM